MCVRKLMWFYLVPMIFANPAVYSRENTEPTEKPSTPIRARYIGSVKYDEEKRVTGFFTRPVANEPNAFYGIAVEYLNPHREPNFRKKFFSPGKENGYLQELFEWISIHKFTPSATDAHLYEAYRLTVANGSITTGAKDPHVSFRDLGRSWVKLGARSIEITHPILNGKGKTQNLTYRLETPWVIPVNTHQLNKPLVSTWEGAFSPGPYNPGYKQSDKVILTLDREVAFFPSQNPRSKASFSVDQLKGAAIEVSGTCDMIHHRESLFTFVNFSEDFKGAEKISNKIAAFIDVYNFQPLMNTVELILIDPSNPYGSQMYFEDYNNKDEK